MPIENNHSPLPGTFVIVGIVLFLTFVIWGIVHFFDSKTYCVTKFNGGYMVDMCSIDTPLQWFSQLEDAKKFVDTRVADEKAGIIYSK